MTNTYHLFPDPIEPDSKPILSIEADSLLSAMNKLVELHPQPHTLFPDISDHGDDYMVDRAWVQWNQGHPPTIYLLTRNLKEMDPSNKPKITRCYIMGEKRDEPRLDNIVLTWESLPGLFDPLTYVPKTKGEALGMFFSLAAEYISEHSDEPNDKTGTQPFFWAKLGESDPTSTIWNNTPGYVAMTLAKVIRYAPKRNKFTDAAREQLADLTDKLMYGNVNDREGKKHTALLAYLTANYFYHKHQITALEYYRTQKGLTVNDLAERAGITGRQLHYYESTPYSTLVTARPNAIQALAQALDIREEMLVCNGKVVLRNP